MTSDAPSPDPRRHMPATLRNRDAILAVLQETLPRQGTLLEIASGSGEHAAFMAPQLTPLVWQPSDYEAENLPSIDAYASDSSSGNIQPAVQLDVTQPSWPVQTSIAALLCCNMIHIAPWAAAEGLFHGAAIILMKDAPLLLYGPFRRNGAHTAPSNAAFDDSLQSRNADWGVRCLDTDVLPLAQRTGFALERVVEMPANNLTAIFRKL